MGHISENHGRKPRRPVVSRWAHMCLTSTFSRLNGKDKNCAFTKEIQVFESWIFVIKSWCSFWMDHVGINLRYYRSILIDLRRQKVPTHWSFLNFLLVPSLQIINNGAAGIQTPLTLKGQGVWKLAALLLIFANWEPANNLKMVNCYLAITSKTGQRAAHSSHRIFLFEFFCQREDIFRHFIGLFLDYRH